MKEQYKEQRLVRSVIRDNFKSSLRYMQYRELEQVGAEALLRAMANYNPEMTCVFSTYAIQTIYRAILREVLKEEKLRKLRTVPVEKCENLQQENNEYDKIDMRLELDFILNTCELTEREMRILDGHFEENKTLEEIGAELNITRERVRQVKDKTIKKIRSAWKKHLLLEKNKKEAI